MKNIFIYNDKVLKCDARRCKDNEDDTGISWMLLLILKEEIVSTSLDAKVRRDASAQLNHRTIRLRFQFSIETGDVRVGVVFKKDGNTYRRCRLG